ncbi:MAG: lamin tail domain-containing protein [Pirellulales bacterium]|nr:lamin tail domain-containing protein [Pirellulales bacterium]
MIDRLTRRPSGARSATPLTLSIEQLEPRLALTGVVINEFLAVNQSGLQDEDGFRADWVELRNTTDAAIDLAGWHLTDNENNLTKWTFPAVEIPANGYLVVFASGKDRAVPGQNLHTNFALSSEGEYLALVQPDGVTVVDTFDPFPAQLADISYGRGGQALINENLVGDQAPVKALVPDAGTSSTWYVPGFDDSNWLSGVGGVGYDNDTTYLPYFNLDVGPQMYNVRGSAYLRYGFPVVNPDDVTALVLRMRYDDGFAVYLNGTLLPAAAGQRNAPATLSYDSIATQTHSDALAVIYEDLDLSAYRHLLVAGENMLAIHGLNRPASSSDFLIAPLLLATRLSDPVTGYMTAPTPGGANQEGSLGIVADTKFSVDRGFYSAPFTVAITSATSGAMIRYTTDGSVPTATTGLIYNSANPPLINKTTTLRAAAFKTGFTPTNVDTQTYIFLDDVIQQSGAGLPPVANWGYAGPDWAMDPDVVNNPLYSGTIKNDLQAVPTVSLVMPWNDWFGGGGQGIYPTAAEIERAVSMEYITADGTNQFQINAGIEIQGGTSDDRWKMDKLSMRVKFTEPYGPEKLDAVIYTNGERDAGAAVRFNTFVLDAHMGYTWAYGGTINAVDQRSRAMFIQDAYVADLQNLAGGAAPHSRFVHLYVNGLYWGLYDMHERPDEHFAESYLGGGDDDYDVIKHNAATVVSTDVSNPSSALTNYAAMLNLVRQDMSVHANYLAAAAKIDVDDFIAYMLVNYYVGNDDWAHQNWYASFNRVDPEGKWRYHSWDAENVLKDVNRDSTNLNNSGGPTEVFQRLIANTEFRLRFNDLAQKHFFNGGLLTPAGAASVYQARMDEIDRAIVGESARWGDNHTTASDPVGAGNPYTRVQWLARQNSLLTNYFPARTGIVLNQFSNRGWRTTLGAPTFTHYGGTVVAETQVTIAKPAGSPAGGVLYYTLDGSDPRTAGGGVAPGAIAAPGGSTTLAISAGVRVRARVFDIAQAGVANDWSAEIDATFLLDVPFPLRITELHYNPTSLPGVTDTQNLEFIELQNTGASPISLDGVRITEFSNTGYTFPTGLTLAAGERIVVARSPSVFLQAYGPGLNVAATGYFDQNLSNGGERIALLGPLGEVLQDFVYDDAGGWPLEADGGGNSLEIIDPLGDPSDPANWRASYYVGGSPGTSGEAPAIFGDFTGDGRVDGGDFLTWQRGFGTPALQGSAAAGDADGDRDVDDADRGLWAANYGESVSLAIAAALAEPASEQLQLARASDSAKSQRWFLVAESPEQPMHERPRRRFQVEHVDAAFTVNRLERTSWATAPRPRWDDQDASLSDHDEVLSIRAARKVRASSSLKSDILSEAFWETW